MNIVLWIIQILLALLFLVAGVPKLIFSVEQLMQNAPPNAIRFPELFMKFIGVVEVLGALGLILPGIFRRRQELTPLAAIGLLILMIGAVVVTIMSGGVREAAVPFVVGLLCAFVAYGRWKLRPLR
jgi:hypothetical protein